MINYYLPDELQLNRNYLANYDHCSFRADVLSKNPECLSHPSGGRFRVTHEVSGTTIHTIVRLIQLSYGAYLQYKNMEKSEALFEPRESEDVTVKGKNGSTHTRKVYAPVGNYPKVDDKKVYKTIRYAASAHGVDAGHLTELWMQSISDPVFMGSVVLKDYDVLIKSLAFTLRTIVTEK